MADLVAKCTGRIYSYCYDRLGFPDAQDATQQTFINAWKGRNGFDPAKAKSGVCGWLATIAYHICAGILSDRSPILIKITSEDHAPAIVGVPFAFALAVEPPEATFRATDVPLSQTWLRLTPKPKLDAKGKPAPKAEQFLEGTPQAGGRFVFNLIAEFDGLQATREFTLLVKEMESDAQAVAGETARGEPRRDKGLARAEHASVEDSVIQLQDERTGTLGAREDIEWLLSHLDKREREVIIRTFYENQPDEQIANDLGISQVSVRQIRSRDALGKMRKIMEEEMSRKRKIDSKV